MKKQISRNEQMSRKLKAAQQMRGLSQSQIAKKLKIRQQTVSYWLNKPESLTLDKLRLLCNVLEVDITFVIKEDREK